MECAFLPEQGCKTAFGFPKSFQEFEMAPFQRPPGQMAAFVSVLEAKAKDAGTAKNDYKQVETRSHHPAQHCSLRGLSPRPMARFASHRDEVLLTIEVLFLRPLQCPFVRKPGQEVFGESLGRSSQWLSCPRQGTAGSEIPLKQLEPKATTNEYLEAPLTTAMLLRREHGEDIGMFCMIA